MKGGQVVILDKSVFVFNNGGRDVVRISSDYPRTFKNLLLLNLLQKRTMKVTLIDPNGVVFDADFSPEEFEEFQYVYRQEEIDKDDYYKMLYINGEIRLRIKAEAIANVIKSLVEY